MELDLSDVKRSPILQLVMQYNRLIRPSIEGPNCIDPHVCNGNCCFIRIDVPKVLADYYIQHGWAKSGDFQRGDVFSFVIDISYAKMKCNFFDKALNGCALHQTGMKPCQCWVYPTGLDPDQAVDKCKKAAGWHIRDPAAVKAAKEIIEEYFVLAKEEAQTENSAEEILKRLEKKLPSDLSKFGPMQIAGVEDTWDAFLPLKGDGFNIGLRSLCSEIACKCEYFSCPTICPALAEKIMRLLKAQLPHYIKINGFKHEYLFIHLKEDMVKQ
jgi:hypothetical protein